MRKLLTTAWMLLVLTVGLLLAQPGTPIPGGGTAALETNTAETNTLLTGIRDGMNTDHDEGTGETSAKAGPVVQCRVDTSAPTGADDTIRRFWCDTTGALFTAPSASAETGASATECSIVSAASTNATSCKASKGNFYGYELYNTLTTVYYLRMYNLATAPTCSSATGFIRSIPIPPAPAAGLVGGANRELVIPIGYGTGIAYCITAGSSSTDNTNAAVGILGALKIK